MATTRLSTHLLNWSNSLAKTSDSPSLDAEVLFKHASGYDDVRLILDANAPINAALVSKAQALIDLRAKGTPIAHLTGCKEFYSLAFRVNSQVLIPRPETELLVDTALDYTSKYPIHRVLELGTGSGAIAIALGHHAPQLEIIASDNCPAALKIALSNAQQHKVNNIQFIQSDWYKGIKAQQFDLIISNPPYIAPNDDHLRQGDLVFEPREALVAQSKGLADLDHIIINANAQLTAGAWMMLEHGHDQSDAVQSRYRASGFEQISSIKDLAGINRITIAQVNNKS